LLVIVPQWDFFLRVSRHLLCNYR